MSGEGVVQVGIWNGEINPIYAVLKAELQNPSYAAMDNAAAAAAVNAKTVAGTAPIPGDAVQAFFMRRAIIGKCRIISEDGATALALVGGDAAVAMNLRAFCANICDSFANKTFASFNLGDVAAKADCDSFTDALVGAGIMSAAQRDELYSLAVTSTPWTEINMGLPHVSEHDIQAAKDMP